MKQTHGWFIGAMALTVAAGLAPAMQPPSRDDVEKMKKDGTYDERVKEAKEKGAYKPDPALIAARTKELHVSWDGDTAVYEAGRWVLLIDYLNRGTRSEGQHGRLFCNAADVPAPGDGMPIQTPFGKLKHWGDVRPNRWDTTGWNFETKETIRPASSLTKDVGNTPPGSPITGRSYRFVAGRKLVTLEPSPNRLAVQGDPVEMVAFLSSPAGTVFERDELSDREDLKQKSVTVLRGQAPLAALPAGTRGFVGQPLFEVGGAILIPTDEIIVGFPGDTTLEQARAALMGERGESFVKDIRSHRPNAFIVTLRNGADGRAFAASRTLASRPDVSYAEPNFITLTTP